MTELTQRIPRRPDASAPTNGRSAAESAPVAFVPAALFDKLELPPEPETNPPIGERTFVIRLSWVIPSQQHRESIAVRVTLAQALGIVDALTNRIRGHFGEAALPAAKLAMIASYIESLGRGNIDVPQALAHIQRTLTHLDLED